MYSSVSKIAEHVVWFQTPSEKMYEIIKSKYWSNPLDMSKVNSPDLVIHIKEGYGGPFLNYDVQITTDEDSIKYSRADYFIKMDKDYTRAEVQVYDDFALKHALVNVYSAFIIKQNWGMLIHSSCLLENNQAFIFAGQSGAGKSTVVSLSSPRPILSDEATIVKVDQKSKEIIIYNSPFRSDTEWPKIDQSYSLEGIHFLRQALHNQRTSLRGLESITELFHRIFYWAHDPHETKKLLNMCQCLVENVPVYQLYFQKNDRFWEEIS